MTEKKGQLFMSPEARDLLLSHKDAAHLVAMFTRNRTDDHVVYVGKDGLLAIRPGNTLPHQ